MNKIPQLCTGSCVKTIRYTTKGPTYERQNENNCDGKPLMPALQNSSACQYFHPQEFMTDRIQRGDSNFKIVTACY